MSTVQEFLANATTKAAEDFIAAFQSIPEDKRDVLPAPTARTPIDLLAECGLLTGYTAETLHTHTIDGNAQAQYETDKAALVARPVGELYALLRHNAATLSTHLRALPTENLDISVPSPWGAMPLIQIARYPYWNITYHQGQLVYIASLYGTAD